MTRPSDTDLRAARVSMMHNFTTGTVDYGVDLAGLSADDAQHYVPDTPSARGLFRCEIALGADVLHALKVTLKACSGDVGESS